MMDWKIKKFDDLSLTELYAVLRLRSEVFVVEQNCVFQDMDNKDQFCYHCMVWENDELIAYTRLVPPGKTYQYSSIGRVVTSPAARDRGIGKLLVRKSIEALEELFGKAPIKIGAQIYLKEFYTSFGFEQCSEVYDEDGIDHIQMIRR
jgi:ElaA protein